jgi:uncharacterized membrane protein
VAKLRLLTAILRWVVVVLVLRVLVSILSNYPDYFPPNFDSTFLLGRERTFPGVYEVAFNVHLVASPVVLVLGLVLLSETVRRRFGRLHRRLGWVQIVLLLAFVLPSSLVMARRAIGGWPSGASFMLLTVATAVCAVAGVIEARRKRFDRHRRWMLRCSVLICSAVVLRLISGVVGLFEVSNPEGAYTISAWASWLVPLAVFEVWERFRVGQSMSPITPPPSGESR